MYIGDMKSLEEKYKKFVKREKEFMAALHEMRYCTITGKKEEAKKAYRKALNLLKGTYAPLTPRQKIHAELAKIENDVGNPGYRTYVSNAVENIEAQYKEAIHEMSPALVEEARKELEAEVKKEEEKKKTKEKEGGFIIRDRV